MEHAVQCGAVFFAGPFVCAFECRRSLNALNGEPSNVSRGMLHTSLYHELEMCLDFHSSSDFPHNAIRKRTHMRHFIIVLIIHTT